jgi:cation-transporting ATPase 13A3/4/5
MYPKPVDFKFNTDSYKFIAVLGIIALTGLIYTWISKASSIQQYTREMKTNLTL